MMKEEFIDEIGPWSEIKLEIIRDYASAYSAIFHGPRQAWARHVYIDAFSGPGLNLSRTTREFVPGSPINALLIDKPFRDYYLVDLDGNKMNALRTIVAGFSHDLKSIGTTIEFFNGDCNDVLMRSVFPKVLSNKKVRALCILDPYKLSFNWEIVQAAGQSKQIELFINFPMMDIERNLLRHDFKKVAESDKARMNEFWGDYSWRECIFAEHETLFGDIDELKSDTSRRLVDAYKHRLRKVAGFACVPDPLPMRNSRGGIVYYLYFASPKESGKKIVSDIFNRYRKV